MFSDLRAGRSSTTVEILPAGILGVEISHSSGKRCEHPTRDKVSDTRPYPEVSDNPRLNWRQRLEIYVGASIGLYYPHTDFAIAISTHQCEVC
ncbi:BnaC07g12110D [Brassica napus]|uniref:(rape) hypothetical protein n=1 Tax=Brassica napus TaxID=3708 RepID=A0A078G5E0_BRANA|nr:unnamed protein product [Brassica napus]CDY20544.1 BnaC07g12110D [Brassica napus]